MKNEKDRRHSGRKVTKIYHPKELPYEEEKWDDWDDHRDGFRDRGNDGKFITNNPSALEEAKIRNKKNLREARIRKIKKNIIIPRDKT